MNINYIQDWFIENKSGLELLENPSKFKDIEFYDFIVNSYFKDCPEIYKTDLHILIGCLIEISETENLDYIKKIGNFLYYIFGTKDLLLKDCKLKLSKFDFPCYITKYRDFIEKFRVFLFRYPDNYTISEMMEKGNLMLSLDSYKRESTLLFYLKCFKPCFSNPFNYYDSKFLYGLTINSFSRDLNLLCDEYNVDMSTSYIEKIIFLLIKGSELLYGEVRYNEITFMICTVGLDLYSKNILVEDCLDCCMFRHFMRRLKNCEYKNYDNKVCVAKCIQLILSLDKKSSIFTLIERS